MLSRTQGLPWSGKSISNGRQRLVTGRQFSSNGVRSPTILPHHGHSRNPCHALRIHQQYRTLSFFGWGSSSKPFPEQHNPPASPSPDLSAQPSTNTSILESTRIVKASHATSDTPDPSILEPVPSGSHEPAFLKNIETALTTPHGPDAGIDQAAEVDIASIPERIGYLKEVCGIDFGWGTTSIFQYILEHVHVYSDLSWSFSLIAVTVAARLLMFPAAIRAQEMGAKAKELQPVISPLREEYKEAVSNQDKVKIQLLGNQIRAISRDSGLSTLAMIKPFLYQVPFGIGGYRLGHAMSALPVPAIEHESFFWFHNLALTDPWILPISVSALTFLSMSASMKSAPTAGPGASIQRSFIYVLPPLSFIALYWQPGMVQIFFFAQAIFSAIQIRLLTTNATRKWFKLPPNRPTSTAASTVTQQTKVAGMNLRSSPSPSNPQSAPEPAQQVSLIDKIVDRIKGQRDHAKDTLASVRKTATGRAEKKIKERNKDKEEKYEFKRRQDAEMERNWRNQSVREGHNAKAK